MKRSNTSKLLNEWKNFLNENEESYIDNPGSSWDRGAHDVADLVDRVFGEMGIGDIQMSQQQFEIIEEAFMMLGAQQLEKLLDKYSPEGPLRDDMSLENDSDMID